MGNGVDSISASSPSPISSRKPSNSWASTKVKGATRFWVTSDMIRSNVRVHKTRFMAAGINIVIMVIAGLQLLLLPPDTLMLLLLLTPAATAENQTKT
jgi:hypothetical protein